jgi:hypothetical protein
VTYGKEFEITYILRNKGSSVFPGGLVVVELSWPSVNEKVNQPIEIKKQLKPGEAL